MGREIRILSSALFFLGVLNSPAIALSVSWYEQETPGSLAGEFRVVGLKPGDFLVRTPGQDTELAVTRRGEMAVVRVVERPAGLMLPAGIDPTLVISLSQGEERFRESYSLVMPFIETESPEGIREEISSVNTDFVGAPTMRVSEPAHDSARVTEGAPGREPASDSLEISPVEVAALMPAIEASEEPDPVSPCPILTLRPGRLSENVGRLLLECGGRMGEWITPGSDPGWTTDWVVESPRILSDGNEGGLDGLLEVLQVEYGLHGIVRDDQIDIYHTR